MHISPDITLIITTYNNPPFLELVLKSALDQNLMPREIIIADDGSTDETRELIDRYRPLFKVPLIHSWIPDEGFRLSKSRNVAIAKATGDYIVMIDGDIIMSPNFIRDHDILREKGCFITGTRARLRKKATQNKIKTLDHRVHFYTSGLSRPFVFLRLPWCRSFFKKLDGLHRARGCNNAFWREDCIKVNGFEENFTGWGFEDLDFFQRLLHVNVLRKNARLMAACTHLDHSAPSQSHTDSNKTMYDETVRNKSTYAKQGIDQYL